MSRRLVIIESPFAGDVEDNLAYLSAALEDSIRRGEAPFASHGLYPIEAGGPLSDDVPEDRKTGIECGLAWSERADAAVFYVDHGMSRGMRAAHEYYKQRGTVVEFRMFGDADVSTDVVLP